MPESANCLPISSSSFSVITLVFVHKISQLDLPASLAAWCDQIAVSEKSADACVTSRNSSLRENFSLHLSSTQTTDVMVGAPATIFVLEVVLSLEVTW